MARNRADQANPANRWNLDYVEDLHGQWCADPESVPESWRQFFQGYSLGVDASGAKAGAGVAAKTAKQSQVASLMYAYRNIGHRIAATDPLGSDLEDHPDLSLGEFDLSEADLDRTFDTGHLGAPQRATLREILEVLKSTYCSSIGVEYLHIQDVRMRRWLQNEMEPALNRPRYTHPKKMDILEQLVDAEVFEKFIHTRYPGQKRFSLEGAETMIPALRALVEHCPELGVEEIVLGMAHRGRLNVLANVMQKSYAMIFAEFEGNFIPDTVGGDGDVKYHLGYTTDYETKNGGRVHLSLTPNPSHLEAVDPVVQGRTRAKQRQRGDTAERSKVLPVLVHGDAAFAGQGLVAETLNLSQLPGYRTGGTVHFIVNNQIGFTTAPTDARSTPYCTDVAKMVQAPIFHVNGDDPEAVVFVMELALRFRQAFSMDVVVDMYCYRRHGHNEGDEPEYTQPKMYRLIKHHPSVRESYTKRLIQEGALKAHLEEKIATELRDRLQHALDSVRETKPNTEVQAFGGLWADYDAPYSDAPVETAPSRTLIDEVAHDMSRVPEGFTLHRKLERLVTRRLDAIKANGPLDWGTAEALAFGTLVREGHPVRLSGQDSGRGTFSHRHAVWVDPETAETHRPLKHMREDQASFCVYNSLLSEAAVLGFDFGYSMSDPNMLIMWEAQFGDFANGAQVIIDQFVVGSESKWQRTSGLVMLLPHGHEGQGPEHSNAYLERYLQACAEDNIQVCNVTTPANYFHMLRRQVKRSFRRPLVLMAPKSLLRHKDAVSTVDDLTSGTFREVIDDPRAGEPAGGVSKNGGASGQDTNFADGVRRVVLCSGKVYYDLLARRRADAVEDVTFVRVEQLYPFPERLLKEIVSRYRNASEFVWLQEESQNRGAWSYIEPRLMKLFPDRTLCYVGRDASASPATGSLNVHREEQAQIVDAAVNGQIEDHVLVTAMRAIPNAGGSSSQR